MPTLTDTLAQATRPLLWLDDSAYCERLLAGGQTPWLDSAEYLAYRRKAQGLLRADLGALPLGELLGAWVKARPTLREAMAAKRRAAVPARVLLADEALRRHVAEILDSLRAAFPAAPLVLALPSPRALVGQAWQLAFDAAADFTVGEDEADACAVYLAEFLRSFGGCGLDALLLQEAPGDEPTGAEQLGWYQPVINLAAHYRWELALELPQAEAFSGEAADFACVIAPRALPGCRPGLMLDEAFWDGAPAAEVPAGGFRFARVPAQAQPEQVLARLAALRQG